MFRSLLVIMLSSILVENVYQNWEWPIKYTLKINKYERFQLKFKLSLQNKVVFYQYQYDINMMLWKATSDDEEQAKYHNHHLYCFPSFFIYFIQTTINFLLHSAGFPWKSCSKAQFKVVELH